MKAKRRLFETVPQTPSLLTDMGYVIFERTRAAERGALLKVLSKMCNACVAFLLLSTFVVSER